MLELAEAQNRILTAIIILPSESVSLSDAHDRILAETICSKIDLPRFDNSAVDGYAVQSKDLLSAHADNPVSLRLKGKIPAGASFAAKMDSGECVRIFTGSPLPSGADAVAMQEDTQIDLNQREKILFCDSVKPWENIRFRGEDVKADDSIAEAGERLSVGRLSVIGAIGVETVQVGRQPLVGLLATGNELREPGNTLNVSEIYESNRLALSAIAKQIGAVPKIYPLVPDTLAETKAALKKAFSECDVVVTTGGVSVGELDFVKAAFAELGGNIDFWKISIKPGKPFVFGKLAGKSLFGLPGNPVSAFVTFVLLAGPALAKMQGAKTFTWPDRLGTLAERLENRGDRRHFFRVTVDQSGDVRSAGIQSSHILSALAKANGLLEIPPNTIFEIGRTVRPLRLD